MKWERRLNIRTAGRDASAEDAHHLPYEPTPYPVLSRLAESGRIGSGNLLVDYGCGKGRVSLFLARATGCRGVGIDFNPVLVAEAEENLRRLSGRASAVFLTERAERYEPPADADRFYFFNPFPPETLRSALARIEGSWYAAPRELLLFFYYPSDEYVRILMNDGNLVPAGEIPCFDLFPGDGRERILCFSMGT